MRNLDFLSRQERFLKDKKRKAELMRETRRNQSGKMGFFRKKKSTGQKEKGLYEKAVEKQIRDEQRREKHGMREEDQRNTKKTLSKSNWMVHQKKQEMVERVFWELSGRGQVESVGAHNARIDALGDGVLSREY